jgi:hypothetical protein
MQDNADSDLRQNIRTILGISVQDEADFDMLICNDGYTAHSTDIHPISFYSETTLLFVTEIHILTTSLPSA